MTRRILPLLVAALLGAGLALPPVALTAPAAAASTSTPRWAPQAEATIHPGVQTYSGGQCTANFVFYDADHVYIGIAAHCVGEGGNTATNGCTTESLPLGSPVEVDGATRMGALAYSSWLTMQAVGQSPESLACGYNDFALVRLHPDDHRRVNPTIPVWGGPSGIATSTASGDLVYSYGNSSLRLGLTVLSPKEGYSLGQSAGGWTHRVYTVTPGIPGDSGSGFIDAAGRAFGVLSTLELLPNPAANGVSDLSLMLDYMTRHTPLRVTLALGTDGSADPRTTAACPRDRVPSAGYTDTSGNQHRLAIDCVTWWGIASGVGSRRYAPAQDVRRDQMASFIARTLEAAGVSLPAARDQGYRDIGGNAHADRINQLAAIGVVRGTTPTTYDPAATVRRDQMAAFIVRAVEHATGRPMSASRDYFTDTGGSVHREAINKVAEAEIAAGVGPDRYGPGLPVRRDQMATFVARTLNLFVVRGDARPPDR